MKLYRSKHNFSYSLSRNLFCFCRISVCVLLMLVFQFAKGQNCTCTIDEVTQNQVEPCELIVGSTVVVSTELEFRNAISQANASGGNMTILIQDGTYQVASTAWYPYITASDLVIRSQSGNRDAVTLTGSGMHDVAPGVEIGLSVVGDRITIADLTIRDVGNHGISTQGDDMFVHNVRIQNTYEQMIKGTSAGDGADSAVVQCCLLEYPAGIGPQFYIGGLDIHEGENWIVRDNVFKNIASPSGSLAEHAIHFWDFSANNIIERNWIINCDRGIGFGLGSSPNEGGIIRNNMIYNDGTGVFPDVGIGLETSPNTKVYNNTIFITYSNAIEYRFAATTQVDIINNLTNQAITSRNNGEASLENNITNAEESYFIDPPSGNLRLIAPIADVVDQGTNLPSDVSDDIDQTPRPQGSAFDIGAHEYDLNVATSPSLSNQHTIVVAPNPATEFFVIESNKEDIKSVEVFNSTGQPMASVDFNHALIKVVIDCSAWPKGIYNCRVNDEIRPLKSLIVLIVHE